jgi:hypothetical protein
MKKPAIILCFFVFVLLLLQMAPSFGFSYGITLPKESYTDFSSDNDIDPLIDNQLVIRIQRVRECSGTSFSILVSVNDTVERSTLFTTGDIFPNWSAIIDVPETNTEIVVTIQLQDNLRRGLGYIEVDFDPQTGDWTGGDFRGDNDGYGHVWGDEFEIWFDLQISDYDDDGLTYWEEMNVYHTNPRVDDRGFDGDNDDVPIEWEDRWGYSPLINDQHMALDPDGDGLTNVKEWETCHWFSDPFRQDVFVEIDWMRTEHFWEKTYKMPEKSKQRVISAFAKENIMLMLDDGWMGGGEEIPFYNESQLNLHSIYRWFFLHEFQNIWRRGIFHYCVFVGVNPWAQEVAGFNFRADGFVVCMGTIQLYRFRDTMQCLSAAGVFMHELGHNLGLFRSDFEGIDNQNTRFPWKEEFWLYGPYRSCMNYRYTWHFVDYSHGLNEDYDFDDWGNLNLHHFLG